ncbi:MAG: septum formation protein Maf [Candidatus Latescibacteria bacterium]|nr:septum formation protein Maf [Candidatus Latescibacterota bacterium]
MPFEFILASGSPRRIELLRGLGAKFRQAVSGVEEVHDGSDPAASAEAAALQKARAVLEDNPGAVVIGADTIVVTSDGNILGKPEDTGDAVEILMKLSGSAHTVITAIAVVGPGRNEEAVSSESTKVWMRPFSRVDARRYVASGEPMDKAGAYGIQVRGALLVERIEGCYFNVVGFPLVLLQRLLQERGIDSSAWLGPDTFQADDS